MNRNKAIRSESFPILPSHARDYYYPIIITPLRYYDLAQSKFNSVNFLLKKHIFCVVHREMFYSADEAFRVSKH